MFIRLGHILKLVFIIYILRYTHRKAMWQIFIRKWVLANQRNERCFTREKNDTPNQNHARDVYLRVQKMTRPIKGHRVSCQNSLLL